MLGESFLRRCYSFWGESHLEDARRIVHWRFLFSLENPIQKVLEEFFSEFIFSGDSHFRRGLENFFCSGESIVLRRYSKKVFLKIFFCSGESIAFRRYSKKVFFEDFFFVLENQSHSEDTRRKFSLKIFFLFWRINRIQKILEESFLWRFFFCSGESIPFRRCHDCWWVHVWLQDLWNSLFAATEERERREKREGRSSSEKALALCRKGHTPTHTYTEFKK